MIIEQRGLDRVKPYEKNARKIPKSAIDKVALSIKEFGWRQPIVVDEQGVILVGHVRRLAALQLKLTEVPVHVAVGLTPAQCAAYRLMDNRSGEETDWDFDLLIPEIRGLDIDLNLTGFDTHEIDKLLATPALDEAANEAPPVPEVPVSRLGDLWICGKHRLLCGDATKAEDVERLLDGAKPFLMVTDPPYGVEYDPTWRDGKGGFSTAAVLQRGKVDGDDRADPQCGLPGASVHHLAQTASAIRPGPLSLAA